MQVTINTTKRFPISPLIYGTNALFYGEEHPSYSRFARLGGNNWTPYNWTNNATNAGADTAHQNSSFLGGGEKPALAVTDRVDKALAKGAKALIQIPMSAYLAADKTPTDVGQTPDYLKNRFRPNTFWKSPGKVSQQEFLDLLISRYGYDLHLALDNEPDIWVDTHPRIFSKPTYQNYLSRSIEAASFIRAAVGSKATIYGAVLSGYMGFLSLNRASDAGNRNFIDFLLAEMKKASESSGSRLLDVLDLHWYPEHRGTNNIRVTASDSTYSTALARMESTRSLWDPSFKENSWITNDIIKKPIALIPEMKARIAAHYPGTKLSISEYYYGGADHISGAIAQADALGVFGREGVFAANWFPLNWNMPNPYPIAAMKSFESFGDTGLGVVSSVPDVNFYASEKGDGSIVLIAVNHSASPKSVKIGLEGCRRYTKASGQEVTNGNAAGRKTQSLSVTGNEVTVRLTETSVTTLTIGDKP